MAALSTTEVIKRFQFENAWWQLEPGRPHRFKQPAKRARFGLFRDGVAACPPGRPFVLAGPRRAGKTVMARQLVVQWIQAGVAPDKILYVSLANPAYWHLDSGGLVRAFMAHHGHGGEAPLYVIFDEIQYLRNWQTDLRHCAAAFPHCRIVAVASAGVPFRGETIAGADPLPGLLLPPLTFAEFLAIRGSEEAIFGPGAQTVDLRQSKMPLLNEEFVRYINFGGFPEGLMTKTEGAPPPTFVRDQLMDKLLHKDLAALFGVGDPWDLNRLFAVLARQTGGEASIEGLARTTGIAKNTVRKYLDFLESAYLIHRVHRINDAGHFYQRAVAFKVFLTTTTLHAALFGPTGVADADFPRLVETAVFSQFLGLAALGDMAYAGWRGGKVDLVALERDSQRPWLVAEFDWAENLALVSPGPKSLGVFVGANGPRASVFILTRTLARQASLRGRPVRIVPAAFVCYIAGKDRIRTLHQGPRKR